MSTMKLQRVVMNEQPFDIQLVFDLLPCGVNNVEELLVLAQVCHGSFDAIYYNHRQRNRVLQHHLATLTSIIMRNEYDFSRYNFRKQELEAIVSPSWRSCKYRFARGPNKHTLCKVMFKCSISSNDNGCETMCEPHRYAKSSLDQQHHTRPLVYKELANISSNLTRLDCVYDSIYDRIERIRTVRMRLSKLCYTTSTVQMD